MNNLPLDLVIPIFNEGKKILDLLQNFQQNIKTPFRVLLCYDSEDDDVFKFKEKFNSFNFKIILSGIQTLVLHQLSNKD